MVRRRKEQRVLIDPEDVWKIKPGEIIKQPMRMKKMVKREAFNRWLKTGEKISIRALSEDEIEISL